MAKANRASRDSNKIGPPRFPLTGQAAPGPFIGLRPGKDGSGLEPVAVARREIRDGSAYADAPQSPRFVSGRASVAATIADLLGHNDIRIHTNMNAVNLETLFAAMQCETARVEARRRT